VGKEGGGGRFEVESHEANAESLRDCVGKALTTRSFFMKKQGDSGLTSLERPKGD